jgi:uncharacterized protein YodC (DUF2158 family)
VSATPRRCPTVITLSSHIDSLYSASFNVKEQIMELKPGDVVMLKSGGHPVTVAEVIEDTVECLWMGEKGDLFRETLPIAVLERAEIDPSDEDEDEEDDDEDDDEEDEDDEDEHKKDKVA